MPAMPIADSSAPIVVGIRHTSNEARTIPVTPFPFSVAVSGMPGWVFFAKTASGCRVATASRKMIVSPASRMFRAISFGVFCRRAPSTSAIMRSMKLSPGFCVIFTMMRSDSTFVPPVTAERSPPDSRITGADSPVIADSSTLAMPSTTSPSPGMISPASTITWSPCCSCGAGTASSVPPAGSLPGSQPGRRRAMVARLALRRVSAWALPRLSATDSARLAKSTVSHSQNAMSQPKTVASRTASTVLQAAPTSTISITGLCHSVAGLSLRSASGSARTSCRGSSRPPRPRCDGKGVGNGLREVRVRFRRGPGISAGPRRAARARARGRT
ncbi:hypothetical protein SHIRM173S_05629 [Streptomyces hirsutus]